MEEESHNLLRPLLNSTATTSTSTTITITITSSTPEFPKENKVSPSGSGSGIIFRIAFIISVGLISIWANYEASRGFSIAIINEAGHETLPGKHFDLFYMSNDKASRIVFTTSKFVEYFLYPNETYLKKQVHHVILRFSSRNMTESVIVKSQRDGEFIVYISPSVMMEANHDHAMHLAVQKGMARIWIHDGLGGAPLNLVAGIVNYITSLAFSGELPENGEVGWPEREGEGDCWKSKKIKEVGQLLKYYEMKRRGFIRRLNQDMRNGWHDRMVDDALGGTTGQVLCATQNFSSSLHHI